MVFVGPGMATLRPTGMVDRTGRVFHPALQAWHGAMPLVEAVRIVVAGLAADPPFFTNQPAGPYGGGIGPGAGAASSSPYAHISPPPAANAAASIRPQPAAALGAATADAAAAATGALPNDLVGLRKLVKERLQEKFQALQGELETGGDRLLAANTQIDSGARAIAKGLEELKAELGRVETEVEGVRARRDQLMKLALEDEDIDIDQLVVGDGPVACELLDAHLESLAIGDTMYELSRVWLEGRLGESLPAAVYLRHLRDLAREQFVNKFLIGKLADEMSSRQSQ
jgi:hypothetical protein